MIRLLTTDPPDVDCEQARSSSTSTPDPILAGEDPEAHLPGIAARRRIGDRGPEVVKIVSS